jgi:hypothetical protein
MGVGLFVFIVAAAKGIALVNFLLFLTLENFI